jgi:hypothetical protein
VPRLELQGDDVGVVYGGTGALGKLASAPRQAPV